MKIENSHNMELPADTCAHLLKFIISVAIREKIVKIDDETEATLLILCCNNIIDACTKLLKLKTSKEPVKEEKQAEKADCCC